MKLWLVSRPGNEVCYDEYDSFVVAEQSAEAALRRHPRGNVVWRMMTAAEARDYFEDEPREAWLSETDGWAWPDQSWDHRNASAEQVGTALPDTPAGTIVCASFNAG